LLQNFIETRQCAHQSLFQVTRDAGLHGLLNFVGELRKVLMQPGEHFALVHVGREIADQFGLSGIPSKFSIEAW
jgi:hypothetical protein